MGLLFESKNTGMKLRIKNYNKRTSTRLMSSPFGVRGRLVASRGHFSGRSPCRSGLKNWNEGVVLTKM